MSIYDQRHSILIGASRAREASRLALDRDRLLEALESHGCTIERTRNGCFGINRREQWIVRDSEGKLLGTVSAAGGIFGRNPANPCGWGIGPWSNQPLRNEVAGLRSILTSLTLRQSANAVKGAADYPERYRG